MLKIHKLKQPQEGRSGDELLPGMTLEKMGFKITNTNKFSVFVAKSIRPAPKPQKKTKTKAKAKSKAPVKKKKPTAAGKNKQADLGL